MNLVFFFSTNYKTSIDEDKIVKIFLEDRSILPRILDKLEIIEEQMGISFWQILIVVALLVILFGRGKISELMGDVAKGVKSFKKGINDDDEPKSINKSDEDSKD